MTSDLDIIAAVRAHAPVERMRLAQLLDLDADEDFSRTLARLVAEKRLYRVSLPAPGRNTNFVYTLTDTGRAELAAPDETPEAAPPAVTQKETPMPRPKQETPSRRDRILALLAENPGITAATIADQLDEKADAVSRDLFALEKKGLVAKTGDKRPFGYRKAAETELPKLTYPRSAKPAKAGKAKRSKRMPKAAAIPTAATAPRPFRVALTGDRTLLMQRPDTREEIELQPHEIRAVTAFLRDLDNVATLIG